MSLEIYRCSRCHFCAYDFNGHPHSWFYALAIGSLPSTVIETLCPICKEAGSDPNDADVLGVPGDAETHVGTCDPTQEEAAAQEAQGTITPREEVIRV